MRNGRGRLLTRGDHNDPVDHLQEYTINLFQELDNNTLVLALAVHLFEDASKTNTKDNGEDDDSRKVGHRKG